MIEGRNFVNTLLTEPNYFLVQERKRNENSQQMVVVQPTPVKKKRGLRKCGSVLNVKRTNVDLAEEYKVFYIYYPFMPTFHSIFQCDYPYIDSNRILYLFKIFNHEFNLILLFHKLL